MGTLWDVMTIGSKQKQSVIIAQERLMMLIAFAVEQGMRKNKVRTAFELEN
jgi:hypothetical protein